MVVGVVDYVDVVDVVDDRFIDRYVSKETLGVKRCQKSLPFSDLKYLNELISRFQGMLGRYVRGYQRVE